MSQNRLVIAGTGSGVGKTTLTIGLMAALKSKGLVVQGFKCGPDYIDPSYHTAVTGRPSRNLDSWMLDEEKVKEIFLRGSEEADISIIEGVMGFLDGKDPRSNVGSTAEISMMTKSPVILVVDCYSMARSAAAIVKGFQTLSGGATIVGVIANQVGSEGHYQLIKTAIEQECEIPVVGYLKKELNIELPERHLGLIPSIERGELTEFFRSLANLVSETIDLEVLIDLSKAEQLEAFPSIFTKKEEQTVQIAVAKDQAFNFYYPENLEILEEKGAKLLYFSPLQGERLPEGVDGLYIGGGFPEEFADELSAQVEVKQSLLEAINNGLPTVAECGGFMYLTEGIETTDGISYEMVGVIPGYVRMQKHLVAIGYREIKGESGNFLFLEENEARGHEFHYSTYHSNKPVSSAYQTRGLGGSVQEGFMTSNLVAGYTHIHFASSLRLVENWISKCKDYQRNNEGV
ncbi:cobyrinate a,c-diamide synthase [Anaerobacillus alkaliphilus]|uniref:Cobyrinate a,c-diamide synthase n=1 Tax=Anaerobacillus alkaliphilus TaxID=1548597 RepID=A0A4Q0VYC7_9BACI|nr:cobyrinate a,c-diamide synthase [Anaerobacillus alkaliphilus]RXJ04186.1 cobyrinate a,c-diamide synthase [Anaerobacillus alkaliphilus]